MSAKSFETVEVRNRPAWREWLEEHHDAVSEIWLVFYKRHTGITTLSYDDAVEEAICFGWIDSLIRKLDEDRYARKFTPRKIDSKWSTINRRRYEEMKSRELLTEAGLARPPTSRSGDAKRLPATDVPAYIAECLKTEPQAWENFQQLAPSYRRNYIGWIDSAKRPETREKRLQEALELLAAGKKLGLK
jgi:uncharacterized protein YdeI (YjbR/CyaY-like superfamily)